MDSGGHPEARVAELERRVAELGRELDETRAALRDKAERMARLEDVEAVYASAVTALFEGVVVQDHEGRVITANPGASRILGLHEDQLLGRSSQDPRWGAIHEDGTPFPGSEHPALVTLRTREPMLNVTMGVPRPDGSVAWVLVNAQPIGNGDRPGPAVVVTFSDITEYKRIVDELARRERHYHALFDHALEGVLLTVTDGQILAVNPAACRMFQRTEDELRALGRAAVIDPDDPRVPEAMAERRRTGRFLGEVTLVRKDGTRFPAELSSVAFNDPDGQPRTSMFVRDLTDRKSAERLKREFVSTVSHELRTPLTSIFGGLRLLEGGVMGALPEPVMDVVRVASSNARRLGRLIEALLDIEKIEKGKIELTLGALDARRTVQEAIDAVGEMAAAAGLKIEARLEHTRPQHGDEDRLVQVLVNFLSNAVKYSPPRGRIVVRVADRADGAVRWSVRDDGPGIAVENFKRIFGRFEQLDASDTRARGGSGLGLAIAKALVEQHGGSIGVESAPGAGAEFWFELP